MLLCPLSSFFFSRWERETVFFFFFFFFFFFSSFPLRRVLAGYFFHKPRPPGGAPFLFLSLSPPSLVEVQKRVSFSFPLLLSSLLFHSIMKQFRKDEGCVADFPRPPLFFPFDRGPANAIARRPNTPCFLLSFLSLPFSCRSRAFFPPFFFSGTRT